MAKKVNIDITTTGAKQAQDALQQTGQSAEQMGQQVSNAGGKGAQGFKDLNDEANKSKDKVKESVVSLEQWALKMVSVTAAIAAANQAIRDQIALIEEQGKKTAENVQSLLKLQYLGAFFQEAPDLRQRVTDISNANAIPFDSIVEAWYNTRSKNAGLTTDQHVSLLREAAQLNQTYPEASLTGITDMLTLYAKKSGETDFNRVQNVLQQTVTEAGGTMMDVGQYLPQFIPVGMAGGLSAAQAAGLWAYATGQTSEASTATTSLRSTFLGLEGRGSPESRALLKRLAIKSDTGFLDKLGVLNQASASGKFGIKEAELFAGREGAAMLLSLIQDPAGIMKTIGNIEAVDRSDLDLVGTMIEDLKKQDPMVASEFEKRQAEVAQENILGNDPVALKKLEFFEKYKLYMRARGFGATRFGLNLAEQHLRLLLPNTLEDVDIAIEWVKMHNPGLADFLDDSLMNDSAPLQSELVTRVGRQQNYYAAMDPEEKEAFNRRILGAQQTSTIINNIVNYNRPEDKSKPNTSPEDMD